MTENETVKEFVTRIWGTCTDDQMEGLLWSCTAFPCIGIEELERQLSKVKINSNGDYNVAMKQAEGL